MEAYITNVVFLSFVLLSFFVHTSGVVDLQTIFILAGQSNMSGRGLMFQTFPEFDPNPNIFRFSANLSWEEAKDPLHADIDTTKKCGRGPGMPFANTLLKRAPQFGRIGLVPCAIGDTSISEWSKGGYLYANMLRRAQAAAMSSGGGGVVRALLWYQGEKDTESLESARLYKSRFEKFVQDVRDDLQLPTLPVIEVALALKDFGNNYTEIVREGQFQATGEVQHMRCVEGRDCVIETATRPAHLTSQGQMQLGMMMAEAFLSLVQV